MNDFVGAVIGFVSAIGAVGAWKIAVRVFNYNKDQADKKEAADTIQWRTLITTRVDNALERIEDIETEHRELQMHYQEILAGSKLLEEVRSTMASLRDTMIAFGERMASHASIVDKIDKRLETHIEKHEAQTYNNTTPSQK